MRTIDLDAQILRTMSDLRDLLDRRVKRMGLLGACATTRPRDHWLPESVGAPSHTDNVARRHPLGWHVLRQAAVSRWFRAGVDAKRVQILAGHHSPAFTLATYTHLLPSDLPDMGFLDVGGAL